METFAFRFVVVMLLIHGLTQLSCVRCTNSSSGRCIETERLALLRLKQSFEDDPYTRLPSWQGKSCCQWEGVGCDDNTGHVTKLDLRSKGLRARDLNTSLLELQHLSYLNLGGNNFQGAHIPGFLGSMKRLGFLGLSMANFSGPIPHELGNLTALQHLDVRALDWGGLHADDFQWASNLLSLKYLDMSRVNMQDVASTTMKVLATLPSLTHLNLSSCELQNIQFTRSSVNSTFFTGLEYLDLSNNWLTPPSLGVLRNMTSLKLLDLSSNNLNTSIPSFKRLVHLDLGSNTFDRFEDGGLFSILDGVCSLKSLVLSYNMIQSEVLEPNNNYNSSSHCAKYSLEFLNLEGNGISGSMSGWLGKLEFLKHLDLSSNSFHSRIPLSLAKLTSLKKLYLSYTHLNGTIPEFLSSLSSLEELDLSENQLVGTIPQALGDLSLLTELHLYENQLIGDVPKSIGKLTSLYRLDLSHNQLNGTIADSLGQLSSLEELDLSSNQLVGSIPKTLGDLSLLTKLLLKDNHLTGDVPTSLGKLTHLKVFEVSNNSLQGIVSEANFANLSNLKTLAIGSNNLTCKMRSDWIPPFRLNYVDMAGCKVGSRFPQWLQTQNDVTFLNFSDANIVGNFPNGLRNMPLVSLDLSMNRVTGPLPSDFGFSDLRALILGSNLLNGSIPRSLCSLGWLRILDLSRNGLSGEIPDCLGDAQFLTIINLADNELSGTVPVSIGDLHFLNWFHVNNNNLSGELPLAMGNCTGLELVDLGENQFSGTIPNWVGNRLYNLKLLRLRGNKLTGEITRGLCTLSMLQHLDLANNHLSGKIPRCLGGLTGMFLTEHVSNSKSISGISKQRNSGRVSVVMKGRELEYTTTLYLLNNMDLSNNNLDGFIPNELCALYGLNGLNLSHNHLSGNIPKQIGNITALESLDLSNNNLSGSIPPSLSKLTMLARLNLSYNNLSGRVPTGNQLQTLDVDPSIYAGNPQLCGDTLPKKCPNGKKDSNSNSTTHEEEDEKDKSERIWLYFSITLGYATGLSIVFGTLSLKRSWRIAYFRFAEKTKEWIIVFIAVKMAKLKRMINNT